MAETFKAKIRAVGSSYGLLIPKEIINQENLKEGSEIEVSILKRNVKLLNASFGVAKKARFAFIRDRAERV